MRSRCEADATLRRVSVSAAKRQTRSVGCCCQLCPLCRLLPLRSGDAKPMQNTQIIEDTGDAKPPLLPSLPLPLPLPLLLQRPLPPTPAAAADPPPGVSR